MVWCCASNEAVFVRVGWLREAFLFIGMYCFKGFVILCKVNGLQGIQNVFRCLRMMLLREGWYLLNK